MAEVTAGLPLPRHVCVTLANHHHHLALPAAQLRPGQDGVSANKVLGLKCVVDYVLFVCLFFLLLVFMKSGVKDSKSRTW